MTPERTGLLHGAVDRVAGEALLIEPMAAPAGDVNARKVADGERPALRVTGSWVAPQIEFARRPHQHAESRSRDLSAQRPTVKLAEGQIPYELRIGDRVLRLRTRERGEIAVVGNDGFGRVLLTLTAMPHRTKGTG